MYGRTKRVTKSPGACDLEQVPGRTTMRPHAAELVNNDAILWNDAMTSHYG